MLGRFRYTLRYIDDLLSCANPEFADYISRSQVDVNGVRGIYPTFLTVSSEQDDITNVSFLDTSVMFERGTWFTKIYDKREHPPLSRVNSLKYPHTSSFLSVRSKYGIITSRLHCFSRICHRKSDFIQRSKMFLLEFKARGYPTAEIRAFILRFLKVQPVRFPFRSRQALLRAMLP